MGAGAGGTRNISGTNHPLVELEAEIADLHQKPSALVFTSGFISNEASISTIARLLPDCLILSDQLNHASMIEGVRRSGGQKQIWRHNDLEHLEDLLRTAGMERAKLIVFESVYSMDGDVAPVEALIDLCADHDALLVLDEAHAVLGPELPARRAAHRGVTVLRMGTLSKALGSLGGFVAGPRRYVDVLRNRARPFIFTTAPTPADVGAALAAVRVVRSTEGGALAARLRRHVDRLCPGHPTPIVPVVLGDEAAALAAADRLLDQGLLVPAIRPPTVPAGTSRLRVALSAAHTDAQVDALATALAALGERAGGEPS
jgi:5-aminolevulinate synthase